MCAQINLLYIERVFYMYWIAQSKVYIRLVLVNKYYLNSMDQKYENM